MENELLENLEDFTQLNLALLELKKNLSFECRKCN